MCVRKSPWLPHIPLSWLINIIIEHRELGVIIWETVSQSLQKVTEVHLLLAANQTSSIAPDDTEEKQALNVHFTEHFCSLIVRLNICKCNFKVLFVILDLISMLKITQKHKLATVVSYDTTTNSALWKDAISTLRRVERKAKQLSKSATSLNIFCFLKQISEDNRVVKNI